MSGPQHTSGTGKGKVQAVNKYGYDTLNDQQITAGQHSKRVGGKWEEVGKLQYDFLIERGLEPDSYLFDVGCGALRGGIHFIRYLQPGRYFGIDVNAGLLRAGIEHELPQAGLQERLPAENLRATDRFECDFGVPFDFALAQSVFTHLPLNHIRLCLYRLAKVMAPGGRFFATFFEAPADLPFDQPHGKRHPERDPYLYRASDFEWAATSVASWEVTYIGDWGHPRSQRMIEFRRPKATRRTARNRLQQALTPARTR